jgi:hypothetical protein
VTLRAEYLLVRLPGTDVRPQTFTGACTATNCAELYSASHFNNHIVRAAIIYHFGKR